MRVVVAPDAFSVTLSAPQAAEAIAEGWRRTAPRDELDLVPLSDVGPGFLDVLHAALGGELLAARVRGPLGDEVPAAVLLARDTAYVEAAQACGLALVPADRGGAAVTTYGVGELVRVAVEAGARRVVVGLGGSATDDGGAGLLAALGATADEPGPARTRLAGVELVAASDVDSPLPAPGGPRRVLPLTPAAPARAGSGPPCGCSARPSRAASTRPLPRCGCGGGSPPPTSCSPARARA